MQPALSSRDTNEDLLLPKIGEHLIAQGTLSRDQLQIALHEQKDSRLMLGDILVRLGFIDESALTCILAERARIPSIDLATFAPDHELLARLPKHVAARCAAIPVRLTKNTLSVAMADPFDILALDELRRHFPRSMEIAPHVAAKAAIQDVISLMTDQTGSLDDIIAEIETGTALRNASDFEHPVIRLVNTLLYDAARRGASDIHFEPEGNFVRIRYRLDGTLRQIRALHLSHWSALSHRIKIMAGMNIADTRSIQDGRFQLQIGGGDVDFRVAIMPGVWGETIVVRLLDHRRSLLPLGELGYSAHAQTQLQRLAQKPQGITLVTGPTGSGKTTTLYSLLRQLSSLEVNIATLEEPVEFQLDLIRQTAIQEAQGIDFASGVRGLLRMDPDILFIGEVRDPDTAQMALRAAMTGHQVYSTLHCNDALGALPRLIDLGLNPRILAGNLSGIIAQRLVRKLCPHCKILRRATADEAQLLGQDPAAPPMIAEARGCEHCDQTGRKGRTVIAEILTVSAEIDDLIARDATRTEIFHIARDDGYLTLQEDGIDRVLARDISLYDLQRSVDLTRMRSTMEAR